MNYFVNTPCGAVQGTAGRHPGTVAYKGIRYATAGRWEYPRQITGWEGIYDATQYGACAWQLRAFQENSGFYYNEFRKDECYAYSEDCLFLNIFSPAQAKAGDDLPVLVYIHGGAFQDGCGHEKPFNEPVWPTKSVIGVTLNYRLGPLGFLCLPQLEEEAGFTGNYGLYDQMTALQWVRDNIRAFGGNPENITLMGQSAGAGSVQLQASSSLTDGLFQKAVMSSGCGYGDLRIITAENACALGEALMARCGCETLAQFRAVPPQALYTAWQAIKQEHPFATRPVIDGNFVVEGAKLKDMPYMAGTTSHDVMMPTLLHMTQERMMQKKGYTWYFDRMLPGDDRGAWHSSDLWYWFGTLENCWRPFTQKDHALSQQMVASLCHFARTGSPELPAWTPSGPQQDQVLIWGEQDAHMGSVD